jgi:hypothetical protein
LFSAFGFHDDSVCDFSFFIYFRFCFPHESVISADHLGAEKYAAHESVAETVALLASIDAHRALLAAAVCEYKHISLDLNFRVFIRLPFFFAFLIQLLSNALASSNLFSPCSL